MREKLVDAELVRNAQELASCVDRSQPVGLDVGALIPVLRLLEAGLPGCDAWTMGLRSTGVFIVVKKMVRPPGGVGKGQTITGHAEFTWEQLRLFRAGPDLMLRQGLGNILVGIEERENEGSARQTG
jgi:hypothetical protein